MDWGYFHHNTSHIMNTYAEITESAFNLLVGNDEQSWEDYGSNEHAEWSVYKNHGVRLKKVCNWVSGVVQYYVQDINA